MKNNNARIQTYILTAMISFLLAVTTSFLMMAADEPIRQAGFYLPLVFGTVASWAAAKGCLLELRFEERVEAPRAITA